MMIDINSLRHEKEKTYLTIMQIVGGLIWFLLLIGIGGIELLGIIFPFAAFALVLWLTGLYFKAVIYGDSVKVTANQYSEIHKLVVEHSQKLNLAYVPEVFINNGNGLINAVAIKFLSTKYVILMSDLVDLMLKRNKIDELSIIIGHELGHHAAGHTNPWKNLLLKPATFIPLLGAAYGRACELTADRIGYSVTRNISAAQNALVAIALGSESLANDTNIDEFLSQENEIPEFMGFIYKIFSTHPRMTRRVIEITNYHKIQNYA
jgi:Zn-dependent protease with chaperone function